MDYLFITANYRRQLFDPTDFVITPVSQTVEGLAEESIDQAIQHFNKTVHQLRSHAFVVKRHGIFSKLLDCLILV